MTENTVSAAEKLRQVREELHQEWVHLQIVGRALTPEEMQRSAALGQAVELIDQALAVLEAESPMEIESKDDCA
jgi:hypothetical protein